MPWKKDKTEILSPLTGKITDLGSVNDSIFSARVPGDGVAVIPESCEVLSPVSGMVSFIGSDGRSFGITTYDSLEVLVHPGLGVSDCGDCFEAKVSRGDRVSAGDLLCVMDLSKLRERGADMTTPVIITSHSMESVKRLSGGSGHVTAGEDVCLTVIRK